MLSSRYRAKRNKNWAFQVESLLGAFTRDMLRNRDEPPQNSSGTPYRHDRRISRFVIAFVRSESTSCSSSTVSRAESRVPLRRVSRETRSFDALEKSRSALRGVESPEVLDALAHADVANG